MNAKPLDGITVVTFEQAVAAPFATRQLADLGARVIKVERDTGDFARDYDTTVYGQSSYFTWLNRSKESIVLDLKSEHGREAARQLLLRADVVVQNLAPGAVDRLGIGAHDALELNPRLIYTSISGYGSGGPYQDKKAYDLLIQCEAGLLSVTGTKDEPAKVGISIADISAGMYAYSGILTALLARENTGLGDIIEVSMLEALGEWMAQPYLYAEYGGIQQPRTGAAHATIAPYGPFETVDGTVFLGVQNEREWHRFCERVLGAPFIASDPRFVTNSDRVRNTAALTGIIAEKIRTRHTEDVLAELENAGIANSRIRDMAEFSAHPQLAARDKWRNVGSPHGPVRVMTPPARFQSFEARLDPVPALGEHTDSILAEIGFARQLNSRSGDPKPSLEMEVI
ncbi:CaiB/BaiF CoA transferase family protein [Arthrobacter sp. NyZ413]|uniref:CaiB/BaiF CoA transferase family protein n=1 Tax=Arthrobacter sp. NyZ413 TaxID=3144669 RepID=UPI003BF7B59B